MRPADMPDVERWAHGVRARYVGGCRCAPCRKANTDYAKKRAKALVYGHSNELVDAAPVRAHLQRLSRAGVGRRSVHAACDVAESVIEEVMRGSRVRIRRQTADRLLAVTAEARADHALVPAAPRWTLIRKLVSMGFTKGDLAQRLGCETKALRLRKHMVLAATALKVERFYNTITAGDT